MRHDILVQRIQARMADLKTNALQVSIEAKLGKTAVRDIIAGKSLKPTMDTIARIAIVLDCSIAYLTGDADDPHQKKSTSARLEMQMKAIKDVVEAGVFKRDNSQVPKIEVQILGHAGYPDHALNVYLVNDQSMSGEGILKGDFVTAAAPPNEKRISLDDGKLLVCSRHIESPAITELSIRKVVWRDSDAQLHTHPVSGTSDVIKLKARLGVQENLYVADDNNYVSIDGVVVRVVRDIS
ncbi:MULTISPECIES: helix-turn-helix domain-containing protein [unclassified Rhizobium]|uniref:helix-turn-helix domain-containing protein n=1 Tax=unclassified Rhizobium TaxID=2613769 RepID=UPI0037F5DBB4